MENGHEPATKKDIVDAIKDSEDRVIEAMRDFQTEILKAFYGYTQTTDARLKEGEQSDIGLRQRLTAVESRILELERRLNMPPEIQNPDDAGRASRRITHRASHRTNPPH